MRTKFPGYFQRTKAEMEEVWKTGIVVLDSNVLLDLYKYSLTTRNEQIQLLNEYKDRLWIANQIAAEYLRNRLSVISSQEKAYDVLRQELNGIKSKIEESLNRHKKHSVIDVKSISEKIIDCIGRIEKELLEVKQSHPDFQRTDTVFNRLATLFDGRVGEEYDAAALKDVNARGKERYDKKIPPGYMDREKDGDWRYGDYVLWSQLIDYAAKNNAHVIFVTGDQKEDWWQLNSRGEKIGPRPELVDEFMRNTGRKIQFYSPEQFYRDAKTYSRKKVNTVIEKEIGEVSRIGGGIGMLPQIIADLRAKEALINAYQGIVNASGQYAEQAISFNELRNALIHSAVFPGAVSGVKSPLSCGGTLLTKESTSSDSDSMEESDMRKSNGKIEGES